MSEVKAIDEKAKRDIEVLAEFVQIYCDGNHPGAAKHGVTAGGGVGDALRDSRVSLCGECSRLLRYAASMRIICPYDPKPSCKKCPTHCYRTDYRAKIREVMRYSGMRLITRGKLGLIRKYFF